MRASICNPISVTSMKKTERQYNEWLDGAMSPTDSEKYERKLGPSDHRLRHIWPEIREALRDHSKQIALAHPDFVNARVLDKIQRPPHPRHTSRISLPRLAWLGTLLLCLFAGGAVLFLPPNTPSRSAADFMSQVISARSANPEISAYSFQIPHGRGSVIWLDNPGYIPADEQVQ